MEVVIAVFLVGVATAVILGGYKAYRLLMGRAGELSVPQPGAPPEEVEVSGEVGPDGLVYLFAHQFVQQKSGGPTALPRDRAFAPLEETELDQEDWALQILYATFCDLHAQACVHFRVVDRDPTFMPPFPQKRWELEVIQRTPFPPSCVGDALDVAFDLMRRRQEQRVVQGKDEPGELWCPLDELVERALKAMRQEISFWERTGIYGDLRNYVASSLMAQGYLLQPGRETWFDRNRSRPPQPNVAAVEELRGAMQSLEDRLAQFRRRHGSPHARGELEAEPGQPGPKNVDPELAAREADFDDMPLDDTLRLSLYETLASLRQLEPSGGTGV